MMNVDCLPLIVGWELTLRCNLRCRHCGSLAGAARKNELTTEEALSLCDQFPDLLVQEVDFTGGEALLREDLFLIANKINKLGITTNIVTHGFGYSDLDVKKIKESGISGVGISIDGLEDTHDYIRNTKGVFASVMRTINLLQDEGIPFNVITTVNAKNISELPELHEKLASEQVRNWRLQAIMPMGRAKECHDLQLDEESFKELGLFIREHENNGGSSSMNIICSDGLQYISSSESTWRGCAAGIVSCGITADGKVKGCLSMPDEIVEGDLRKKKLWDIWFDPNSFAYNRSFSSKDLGENCISCEKAEECKGGCSSSSFVATNSFHNDPFCFYRINNKSEISCRACL